MGAGCGDNQSIDLEPRQTPPPVVGGFDDVDPPGAEFFIPGGNFVPPNVTSRFVKNPVNPEDLIFIPNDQGGAFYWKSSDKTGYSIMKAPHDGGAATVLARLDYDPNNLIGDGNGLYWTNGNQGSIFAYPFDEPGVVNIYDFALPISALTVDSDFLFVGLANGDIVQADRRSGTTALITSADGVPSTLVREGTAIYWPTYTDGDGGQLFMYDFEKGITTQLLSGYDFDNGIQVDQTNVYWADPEARAVMAVDRRGGEPFAIAQREYQLTSLTSDRFYIYYSTESDGLIKAVPKFGGDAIPLSSGVTDIQQMLVTDDQRLFVIGNFITDNIFYLNL